jgi:hypothetical protein
MKNMSCIGLLIGTLLLAQGLVFWGMAGFEGARATAAIPSAFGILLIVCSLMAKAMPNARKHIMHLAVLLALLGVVGGAMMFFKGLGAEERDMKKLLDQGIMAILCVVFIVLAVNSFIQARRNES